MPYITANQVHGQVISYTAEIYDNVQAPFTPLDNRENPRPDWQEYWPIRKFLLNENLEEDHYYGFFSPRFQEKTGLNAAQIVDYVTKQSTANDIILFSPQPDMGAFFKNIFDQNEVFDTGFKKSSQNFCNFAELNIDISPLVMDSTNIVFSNYFLAKPRFLRRWIAICEILFNVCENYPNIAQLHGWLHRTNYRNGIERKVFLLERIASLILSTESEWKSHAHSPFLFAYSGSKLNKFPEEAVKCDALKIAFNKTQNLTFLKIFNNVINSLDI
jgi:hypothetical protein